jgi:hypothetical protein
VSAAQGVIDLDDVRRRRSRRIDIADVHPEVLEIAQEIVEQGSYSRIVIVDASTALIV